MTAEVTLGAAVRAVAARLAAAGVETPRLDARLLVAEVLGLGREAMLAQHDRLLGIAEQARIAALAERRAGREPVSRILGRREFWSLSFAVTPAVLDPRPDSETLVEAALACLVADRPARVLDLGTGSGCLLLSVLHERPLATGVGIDLMPQAVAVAAGNARALGLAARASFRQGDWGAGLDERFDLVLCNPPYVAEAERRILAPEVVEFDPAAALFAGPDGLDAYGRLAPALPGLLHPGAVAILELGQGQAAAVEALLAAAGLEVVDCRRDLGGIARALVARLKQAPASQPAET